MSERIYNVGRKYLSKTKLALIGAAFLALFIQNPSFATADWLHFGYDNQYTSYNPEEKTINVKNVKKLKRKWGIGCDDEYFSVIFRTPAIYKGKLYTSRAGGRLTAYNAQTGQELWQFGDGNYAWAPQPIVSEKSIVYYMEKCIPTYLYAVNRNNGKKKWKAPIGFDLGYSGAVEAVVTVDEKRKVVYLVENKFGGDGKLYALNKRNGKIRWYMSKAKNGVEFKGNYVLLKDNNIFALAKVPIGHFESDKMLRINAKTKKIEMRYNRPKPEEYYLISYYTLCNDILAVVFSDMYTPKSIVVTYNINSPTIVWQEKYSYSAVTGAIACNTDKNILYVPTDPYLYALNANTGKKIWKYTGYGAIYNPSIANGIVYFISDTNMYAIKENNKKKLFTFPLGYEGDETTQVAISNGMLYFSGNGGTCDLFALHIPKH